MTAATALNPLASTPESAQDMYDLELMKEHLKQNFGDALDNIGAVATTTLNVVNNIVITAGRERLKESARGIVNANVPGVCATSIRWICQFKH